MRTVKIGSVGLGRLGVEHARNIATQVPGAVLTAVCDVDESRVKQVCAQFDVPFGYTDFEEMCADPEVEAIVIATPSALHTEQIECALKAGKHVFCDKPLGTTVRQCRQVEAVVEGHADQVFMLGFMRRYDKSYIAAKRKIDAGDIGKVILVRSYTQDPRASIESTLEFAPRSGGQFLDMCVHDIDLVRWFTGSEPRNMWGIGGVFEFELYRALNDGDNVAVMLQCENEAMAFIYAGRAAAHGCNVETEIIGTKGTLRIGSVPGDTLLEVMSEHGVCRECYPDFLHRWHEAYIAEMCEFVNCIRDGRRPEATVYDGTAVSEIAYRCKESFECGEMLPLRDEC